MSHYKLTTKTEVDQLAQLFTPISINNLEARYLLTARALFATLFATGIADRKLSFVVTSCYRQL